MIPDKNSTVELRLQQGRPSSTITSSRSSLAGMNIPGGQERGLELLLFIPWERL